MMVKAGFARGSYSVCVFHHKEESIRAATNGDDVAALGATVGSDWFRGVTQGRTEAKLKSRLQTRKPGAVRILNGITTVANGGSEHEADQRRAEISMMDMEIDEGSRGLTTPGSNSEGGQDVGGEVKGDRGEHLQSRGGERKLPKTK